MDVRPDNARPDYPRPLAVRKEWKSLNGLWDFDFDDKNWGAKAGWKLRPPLTRKILVPFTFESALSGIGKGDEVHERVWYRRDFEVPRAWRKGRVLLNFNASDWETQVWVNGKAVGEHLGGYTRFSCDITDALNENGKQEVVVSAYDPADPGGAGYQPKGKQLGSKGIWYTRTTGIWQSVWMEPVPSAKTELWGIRTEVDPKTRRGTVTLEVEASEEGVSFEVEVTRTGRRVALMQAETPGWRSGRRGKYQSSIVCSVEGCNLWSPESPALYDLKVRFFQNGRKIDELSSYCAFRKYEIKDGRLALNGKPYFLRGVLDQGYWPDGILTPPSDAAIRYDVEMTKKLGFNMARKHVKVEDRRWYYWCDRLGLIVWQDMPSSHNLTSEPARNNFLAEWVDVIGATRSYPSVLHWIPFNENWGNPGEFQDEVVLLTRRLDPSRPITDASGWTQRSETDVIDVHEYSNNLLRLGVDEPTKPKVVGEYGGVALPVVGHTWTQGWGYQMARSPEALLRKVRYQTSQLFEARNLSGFVYTQLTDVEQEMNGLLTYDRLPKADIGRLRAIFEGRDRSLEPEGGFVRSWSVLGPLPTGTALSSPENSPANRAVMRQILDAVQVPGEGALQPRVGDTIQIRGKLYTWRTVAGTEDALDFHRLFGAETRNQVAYAVAQFDVPYAHKDVSLLLRSDDGARVWLNGREVWSVDAIRGVNADEDAVTGLALKPGRNVLVVKVGQGVGGWGLSARFELRDGSILPITPSK